MICQCGNKAKHLSNGIPECMGCCVSKIIAQNKIDDQTSFSQPVRPFAPTFDEYAQDKQTRAKKFRKVHGQPRKTLDF